MKRHFLSVALGALLLATPAAASVTVSAGEHGAFSRVVVAANAGEARIEQDGRIVTLRFAQGNAVFNLSDLNVSRKARRIRTAAQGLADDGAELRLELACDCLIESSRLPDGRLVIDIIDANGAPATVTAPAELTAATPPPETQTAPTPLQTAQASAPAPQPAPAATRSEDVSIEQAQQRMIDLLQQAASDGLVTIRQPATQTVATREPAPAPAQARSREAAPQGAPTAVTPAAATTPAPPATPTARECLDASVFEFAERAFDANPLLAIAEGQARLAHALPGAERDAARKLAAGYLTIGFGEEALATLTDIRDGDSVHAALARIIAERPLKPGNPVTGAANCSGAHALWQAAAGEPAETAEAIRRAGDAVNALPRRARAIVAAQIARKLVLAEDWASARKYYRVANAAADSPTADLQFIAAQLLEQEGRGGEAQEMLLALSAGNTTAARDALLALARRYESEEAEPHQGFFEDIGALATTERGSAPGGEAALREAVLWAEAGNIEAAIMLYRSAAAAPDAGEQALVGARALLAAAFASDDEKARIAALAALLEHTEFLRPGEADTAFRAAAAEAATALGLPNTGLKLAGAARSREEISLRARMALAANEPDIALAAAAPYADEESFAAQIVRANLALDRSYAALAAASSMPEGEAKSAELSLAAWRAGDWTSAARAHARLNPVAMDRATARRFALSAYMAGESGLPAGAETVLAERKDPALPGLRRFFAPPPEGGILDRGRAAIDATAEELRAIAEVLRHE